MAEESKVVEAPAVATSDPAPAVEATAAVVADASPAPAAAPSLLETADAANREGATKVEAKEAPKVEAKAEPKVEPKEAPTEVKEAPKVEAKTEPLAGEKPAEAPKEGEKTAEALAPEPPAQPKYEAFKLPETLKADNERLDKLSSILGEAELAGKADHSTMQELGQKLVNLYAEEATRMATELQKHNVDVWNRIKEGWVNEFKSDPDIGGNRVDTTLGNAKYAFQNYLGLNADQQKNLMSILDNAGVSSHPLLIRGLNNLYERFKPAAPAQPNLPGKSKGAGQRNWYETTEVSSG